MGETIKNREAQREELSGLLERDPLAGKAKALDEFGWSQRDLDKFGTEWIYGIIIAEPAFALEIARWGIWSESIINHERNRSAVRESVRRMIQDGDDLEVARDLAEEVGVLSEFDELS